MRHKRFFKNPDDFTLKEQKQKHQSPGTVYIVQSIKSSVLFYILTYLYSVVRAIKKTQLLSKQFFYGSHRSMVT